MKKVFLVCCLLLISFNLTVFAEEMTNNFSDFDLEKENLIFCGQFGIFVGYEDGTFKPDNYITRAEMVNMLIRERKISSYLSADTPNEEINFTDVDNEHPMYEAIKTAVNAKMISGYGDGTFRPDEYVTYEQAIKMILSMLGYEPMADMYGGYPTGYMALGYNNRFFKAAGSPLDWEKCDIENMTEVRQKEYLTRREAARMISRAFLTEFCIITGIDMNWDGSHTYELSIGGEDSVAKTIYSTSGNVQHYQLNDY